MKISMTAALAAAMLTVWCGAARAGEKSDVPVTFTLDAQGFVTRAVGMLGTARNSADNKQSIGCALSATSTSIVRLDCEAQNAAGRYVHCLSFNAALIAVAQSLNGDSLLDIGMDQGGNCTSLYVVNGSSMAVKLP